MAGKRNISYIKNDEPSFIKAFKQKVGYKEGPTVDSKREELEFEEDDERSDVEDERPQVVVLRDGDLSAEEAEKAIQQQETKEAEQVDEVPEDGKIQFKKPTKRQSGENNELNVSSAKKSKEGKSKKQSSSSKVKNSSLLSFDDEEEEDT